jgi:hypothetical protein
MADDKLMRGLGWLSLGLSIPRWWGPGTKTPGFG